MAGFQGYSRTRGSTPSVVDSIRNRQFPRCSAPGMTSASTLAREGDRGEAAAPAARSAPDSGRAARLPIQFPGLGGRGDESSPRGDRGGLCALGPVRAPAYLDERLGALLGPRDGEGFGILITWAEAIRWGGQISCRADFPRIGTLSVTTMMRKCCQNCHFLAKEIVNDAGTRHRWSWNQRERSELRLKEHYAAQCAQGVWDTGIDPHLNAQLPKILLKQRGDSCFFLAAQSGMSFPAAEKLIALQNLKKKAIGMRGPHSGFP